MKKICRKCNKNYEENVKLCEVCGGELEEDLDKLQTDVVINNSSESQEITCVEIYRASRICGMMNAFKIYLDDQEIGRISNGDKKRFELAPGLHEIRVKLNWSFLKSEPFSFKVKEGDFVRLRTDYTFGGFATFIGWWMMKAMFSGGKVIKIEQY